METQTSEIRPHAAKKPACRESFRKYDVDQIEQFFDMAIEEGKTVEESGPGHPYQYYDRSTLCEDIQCQRRTATLLFIESVI
jgi:hypothetical protein